MQKILAVLEDRKSFSVGGAEENKTKNRDECVIPYDRNRVILTPVPGREHSTYINASFIESYDNSESFIITQDPAESTIADFWRMISEHCISTIVMLSDVSIFLYSIKVFNFFQLSGLATEPGNGRHKTFFCSMNWKSEISLVNQKISCSLFLHILQESMT